jgi:FkbM family methyltransferase
MALSILPEAALQLVKKRHYLSMVRSFSLENESDLKVVKCLVKPGDYVVDIGANIGVYTKVLSELVGQTGRVYSVEPFPSTFEILAYNVKKLGLANVEAIKVAVSDRDGVVNMSIPHDSSGAQTHYTASVVSSGFHKNIERTVEVPTITIDTRFLPAASKIAFVKCDVEGHELACLKGARKFLDKTCAWWLMEVCGDPDEAASSAQQVFSILLGKGYSAWWFDGTKIRPRYHGDKSTNYFFFRDEQVEMLKSGAGRALLA